MKFAFIIMGSFNSEKDRAKIHQGKAQIIGVSSIEEACAVAQELYQSGIDCIGTLRRIWGEEGPIGHYGNQWQNTCGICCPFAGTRSFV